MRHLENSKYTLERDFHTTIGIKPAADIVTPFIVLRRDGRLHIRNGYCWGGLPCPFLDVEQVKRAALIHDALHELMRQYLLPACCKPVADRCLALLAQDDGAHPIVAKCLKFIATIGYSANAAPRNQPALNTIGPVRQENTNNNIKITAV